MWAFNSAGGFPVCLLFVFIAQLLLLQASTELGAFRAKYDEEKLTMGDQYKATMEVVMLFPPFSSLVMFSLFPDFSALFSFLLLCVPACVLRRFVSRKGHFYFSPSSSLLLVMMCVHFSFVSRESHCHPAFGAEKGGLGEPADYPRQAQPFVRLRCSLLNLRVSADSSLSVALS